MLLALVLLTTTVPTYDNRELVEAYPSISPSSERAIQRCAATYSTFLDVNKVCARLVKQAASAGASFLALPECFNFIGVSPTTTVLI